MTDLGMKLVKLASSASSASSGGASRYLHGAAAGEKTMSSRFGVDF